MKSPYVKTAVVAAFVAFVSPALATSVIPVPFTGTPTPADVVRVCNLPLVVQPGSPAFVDINNVPQNSGQIFTSTTDGGWFKVELQQTATKPPLVTFTERSSSVSNQFFDTPGIEAVVLQSSQTANIYCYVNSQGDSGLTTPAGNSVTHAAVYWVKGPCGLVDQTTLPTVCQAYSTVGPFELSVLLPAHLGATQSKTPLSLCGCNTSVPRFCDSAKAAGTPGSCNPGNEGFNGLQTLSVGTSGATSCFTYNIGGTWMVRC